MKDLIKFDKSNIVSKFKVDLDQKDLVDVFISEWEKRMDKKLKVIRDNLKATQELYSKIQDQLQKRAVKVFLARYDGGLRASMQTAFSWLNEKVNIIIPDKVSVDRNEKVVCGDIHVQTTDYKPSTAYRDNGAGQRISFNKTAKFDDKLRKFVKDEVELEKGLEKLRNDECEINDELEDIDKKTRHAKAEITKKALGKSDLRKLIPEAVE